MPAILKVVTRWDGFSGAPGYTNLFFRDFGTQETGSTGSTVAQAQQAVTRVNSFFDSIKGLMPTAVKLNIQPEVSLVEDTDGTLLNVFNTTAPATISGTSTGAFSGPVGAVVNLRTTAIRNNRRIRGRIFLVPLASTAYDNGGKISVANQTTLQTAATALASQASDVDLGVWGRPSGPSATDGVWAGVVSATVPSLSAVLRSRRD